MEKFLILPERSSYAVTDGTTFLQTKLDGGASRFRRDKLDVARIVDISWMFDPNEYLYFTAFYNTVLADGSLPFTLDLILDHPYAEEHEAHFVQDTKKLSGQSGLRYNVTCQLEVLPLTPNAALDLARVAAYEADPNTNLAGINITEDSPPVTVGSIPSRSDPDTSVINTNYSSYFDDPDTLGLTFSSANLPNGLSINPSTGVISGTINQSPSSFFAMIFATNSAGYAQQEFVWQVQVFLEEPVIL